MVINEAITGKLIQVYEIKVKVHLTPKGRLTRHLNAGKQLLDAKRLPQEIFEVFTEAKAAHAELSAKHEEYTTFLNDEEYDEAEGWMEDCTREYTRFSMAVNDYTESNASVQNENKNDETAASGNGVNKADVHEPAVEVNDIENSPVAQTPR